MMGYSLTDVTRAKLVYFRDVKTRWSNSIVAIDSQRDIREHDQGK